MEEVIAIILMVLFMARSGIKPAISHTRGGRSFTESPGWYRDEVKPQVEVLYLCQIKALSPLNTTVWLEEDGA